MTQPYPTVRSDVNFPELEQQVLNFWNRERVFDASVEQRPAQDADGASNAYVFYDGPPFANGLPHHGHLLTGYVKDAVARYQTMLGKRVERRFGWDCHGLPAEMEAEKQLGVSGRQQIMAHGVEAFNQHCRTSVMQYRSEWEAYVNRQARWVDFENDYKTMDMPYMESVLWAFKELHKKGLIFEGFKVMPYSWAAETVLSSSEIRMDDATREKVDKAITVAFKLNTEEVKRKFLDFHECNITDECYLLAWTTTPWTLPSNLALAVSEKIEYTAIGAVKGEAKKWFILNCRDDELPNLNKEIEKNLECKVTNEAIVISHLVGMRKAGSLVGLSYEPLFPFFANHPNAFRVLDGTSFIEEGSGTGVVHMAPGFGEDDMRVCAENGIEVVVPVDNEGRYTDAIYDLMCHPERSEGSPHVAGDASAKPQHDTQATIETKHCVLRVPSMQDIEDFICLQTNKQAMEMMNGGLRTAEEARHEHMDNMQDFRTHGHGQWFIYHKETGQFMGRAGVSLIQQSGDMPARPTLRCCLLPEFWGGGYGMECSRAVMDFTFAHFPITEIAGGAHPDNKAAYRMMETLGMRHVADVQFIQAKGPYFLITREEWLQRHPERSEGSHPVAGDASAKPQHDSAITLSLKGLNVIAETKGKREDEPYTEAQLAKYGLANLRIIQWLKQTGQLIKQEDYAHNYPHCWRTDTPIIYKAMSSWFVDVPQIRDRMVELNQQINWIPEHVKDGRFGKWIENAREWSISRSRFWGCPIPVWRSDNPENNELYVFGSVAELEAFFGVKVEDLHKPFIDTLTKPDPTNPNYTIKRVDEVFDCWFESGSMPYAQVHYPFENKEWFEANFPADFIVEYEAQTRGWFYNMMVLSVALFDRIPFKNCICHGVVLDNQGRKLSKKLKNYISPMELFNVYGSDALRWFMLSSTIMRGNELFLDPEGLFIRDAVRLYIKPLWNAYHFFCLYANADGVKAQFDISSENIMDRYILAKLQECVDQVRASLDAYDTPSACNAITAFLEVLNNWYIRRNRSRFWGEAKDADKLAAYNTLYSVLHILCRLVTPFLPQVSEAMYAGLVNGGIYDKAHSVHLTEFPTELDSYSTDANLLTAMDRVQDICNTAHAIRNEVNIRIRQPLASLSVYGAGAIANPVILSTAKDLPRADGDASAKPQHDTISYFKALIADETNVKDVVFSDELEAVATRRLKIHFPIVGKRLGAKMKALTAAMRSGDWSFNADGTVAIEGETLSKDEFEFTLESTIKEGAGALAAQDGLVVLDTVITPELQQEGIARDVVRLIQQSRKDAGLDVADRIILTVQAEGEIAASVLAFRDYIAEQTLCVEIGVITADDFLLNDTAAIHHVIGREFAHTATHKLNNQTLVLNFSVGNEKKRAHG